MKRFKLSLFMGLLLTIIIPNTVLAAEYQFDTRNVEKTDGLTKIPVLISVDGTETIENGKLSCKIASTEVMCEIEPIEGTFAGSMDSTNNNYVFAPLQEGGVLSVGTHKVAYVKIINTSSVKQSSINVELTGSTINNISKTDTVNTSVTVAKVDTPKSTDATIKSLSISVGKISPEFSPNVYEYTIYDIADTINSIRIKPVLNGTNANYNISGGKSQNGSSIVLNQGENKITIEIIAEDPSYTQNYKFTVYRGDTSYNSARLESLNIGKYTLTPAFDSNTTEYTLTVPNTVTTISDILEYKTKDEAANVLIKGQDNFVVGTNTLTLTVDNVSGDETVTYKVIINRLSEENIEILKYFNSEVTFKDADGIQTTLKIDEFERTYPIEYSKITNNEYKFDKEGNIIIEEQTDEDEEKDEENEDDKSKTWLIIVLIIVGILIIAIAGVLIFRKKDPKDDKKNKSDEKEENKEEAKEEELKPEPKIGEDFSDDENKTVDIDEALNDLMNTKQYEFQDEIEKKLNEEKGE